MVDRTERTAVTPKGWTPVAARKDSIRPRLAQPIYVREVLEEVRAAAFETVCCSAVDSEMVVLLSVMRDEAAILDDFLAHYRRLGVERFVVLDNGSTDGTAERLAAEADIDVHRVRRRFLPQFKQGWINRAIALYGYDRWYLYADADEHITFDGAGDGGIGAGDGGRGFRDLIALAEARGLRRVRGMLIDMYAEEPLSGATPAGPLAERFPLFDGASSYAEFVCKQRLSRKGGPRKRLFAARGLDFDPEMTKYPLFHIRAGEVFDNPHHLHPYAENFVSPCHLGILHYKFNDGFRTKVDRAVAEAGYFNGSVEYRCYHKAIAAGEPLDFVYEGTRRYRGPADLVASGLVAPLAWPGRETAGRPVETLFARMRRALGFRTSRPAT